jgi:heme-degrading monooxygenase HmoA
LSKPNYSLTTWIVRPENEDEFVRRWTDFAEWSSAEGLAASAKLLRDVDDPKRFISFGPWETLEAIRRWRTLEGFQVHVAALSEVVEDFDPRTYRLVTEH